MAVIKGGFEIVKRAMLKELMKRGDDGIMLTLPKNELVDLNARITMDRLIKAGIDPESLTSPDQVLNVLENINNQMVKNARVISADTAEGKAITDKLFGKKGEVVEFPQKRTFKEEIEAMKKSGDIVDSDNVKISEKITDRDMFKNSNLNKKNSVTETISYIKTLEPIEAMKEANSVIGRKGKYKNLTPEESKKILTDTEDHIFERDIPDEDFAKGGRAGYAVGNQVMPPVDARMNLDYNTLVDQNTAQRDTQTQSRNLNTNINTLKASASVPYNFAKGILGNFSNPQDLTQVSLTDAQKARLTEIAKTKGTATGNIDYSDYGSPTPTFSGINSKTMSPLDASLALTMGGTNFRTNSDGEIEFLGGKYDFEKSDNPLLKFIDQGGVAGLINKGGEKLFNVLNPSTAAAAEPSAMPQGSPGQLNPTMADVAGPSRETIIQRILEDIENTSFQKNQVADMYPDQFKTGLDVDYLKTLNPDDIKLALDNSYLQGQNFQNPDFSTGRIGGGRPFFRYGPEYMEKTNRSNPLSLSRAPTGYNLRNQLGELESILGKEGIDPYRKKLDDALMASYRGMTGNTDLQKRIFGLASGGRAGYYTGGMVDVEPNLSDIGHGSDALMARTRLVAPDSQATTSTGLNYLLAEDNDNIRVPFAGGGMSKRAFLKLLATLGGGVAAAKTGILGLGKGAGKQVTKEVVKEAATGQPPAYFLNLASKIKTLGDDVTETAATLDRQTVKQYKDYTLTEDVSTGTVEILKKERGGYREDVYMSYKVDDVPVKGKKGSSKVEEYEEFTARPDGEGKMKDIEQGVPDEVVQEGTIFEDNLSDFGKADGGRIGFSAGNLAKLGITGSSRRFLEKIFGKGSLDEMIKRDPEMHRGLLEVTEMFRNRDKEGLKMYMQKFLPHMDDTQIEEFIVGDAVDSAGQAKFGLGDMQGQLIRLGSGRDYAGKIEAMKKLDNAQKLNTLDVTEEMIRKPNASGGIQTMLGE